MKKHRLRPEQRARGKPSSLPTTREQPLIKRLQADSGWLLAYRALVVAMQAATIVITWQLWQVRSDPPLLPALTLPQFNIGPWLLASLGVVLAAPRIGLALHAALLVWAMLLDQLRMQPEFISMWLLMLGTLTNPSAKLIARTHLVTIWFFAAFHKLICARYYMHTIPPQFIRLTGDGDLWPAVFDLLRGSLAVFEMSLAVFAVMPRTRKWCAWQAAVFHLGVLQYLMFWSPTPDGTFGGWNQAVWPWNIALAPASFALLRTWHAPAWQDFKSRRWLPRAIVVFMCIYPIGYYVGLVDAYLAHCLYSLNTPVAAIVRPNEAPDQIVFLKSLNVPFPPTTRLFKAYFAKVADPGDVLLIKDYRQWARARGESNQSFIKLNDDGDSERIAPLPRR